jgi:hypothetical protein
MEPGRSLRIANILYFNFFIVVCFVPVCTLVADMRLFFSALALVLVNEEKGKEEEEIQRLCHLCLSMTTAYKSHKEKN